MLVAIDPGVNGLGVAEFQRDTIKAVSDWRCTRCVYVEFSPIGNPHSQAVSLLVAIGNRSNELVLEWPQVYSGRARKGDQDDILRLAAIDGAIMTMPWGGVRLVTPHEWKGAVPADIMTERLRAKARVWGVEKIKRVFPDGSSDVCPTYLQHNALDAFGLGVRHLCGPLR